MRNSADAISRDANPGRKAGGPNRGSYSRRRHGSRRSVNEPGARSTKTPTAPRLDAAIGIGNGLILGSGLWFLGYLAL
jgi:hypothetical protein